MVRQKKRQKNITFALFFALGFLKAKWRWLQEWITISTKNSKTQNRTEGGLSIFRMNPKIKKPLDWCKTSLWFSQGMSHTDTFLKLVSQQQKPSLPSLSRMTEENRGKLDKKQTSVQTSVLTKKAYSCFESKSCKIEDWKPATKSWTRIWRQKDVRGTWITKGRHEIMEEKVKEEEWYALSQLSSPLTLGVLTLRDLAILQEASSGSK